MNQFRVLLLICLLSLLAFGCKDEPETWTRYEYLNEVRDYIYFKSGTWWVYKKIPSGELDTIVVYNSWIDTVKLVGDGNTLYYELLEWSARSKLDNYNYRFNRGPGLLPDPSFAKDYMITLKGYGWSKSRPGDGGGHLLNFLYPFDTSWNRRGSVSDTRLVSELDTMIIQGITYLNVKTFEASSDFSFIYDDLGRKGGRVQYSWAPHFGIIKRQHMTKNQSWELVDKHIVQ